MKPKLAVLLILPLLASCTAWETFQAGGKVKTGEAADEALETSLWALCNASTAGAVRRRFNTEEERIEFFAWCDKQQAAGK